MILAADSHARNAIPRARRDDFMAAQERKWRFKLELARRSPPLIEAGDLFDQARSDQELEQRLISLFREYQVEILCIPGQHDLPDHSLKQYRRSSMAVLEAAGVIRVLTKDRGPIIHMNGWAFWGCAWGEEPDETMVDWKRRNMLIWHKMVTSDPLWPGQELVQPGRLLRLYPQYDVMVTGDNHGTIVKRVKDGGRDGKGRILINPGSMMRQTAIQVDHQSCVFRLNDDMTPEQIFLPIEPDVLDLTQLNEEKARDSRFEAFAERLETPAELGLEFNTNLKLYLEANPVRESVRELVWRMVG